MSESDFCFPRTRRLLTGADFSRVFEQPARIKNRAFLALHRKSDLPQPRLGLAVSRKKLPRAIDRNRFKRLARESFRLKFSEGISVDIVIIAYGDAKNLDNTALFNAFEKTWKRIDQFYS